MCQWNGTTKISFYSGLWPIPETIFSYKLRVNGRRRKGVEPGLNELTTLSPKFRISKM